jgi:hypothetical protein
LGELKAHNLGLADALNPLDYLGLLGPLVLAQSHARAAAVFVDELDAGCFQRPTNGQLICSGHRNFTFSDLRSTNSRDT